MTPDFMKDGLKILIIDDNPHDCVLYKRYLEKVRNLQNSIVHAETGEEGIERYRELRPDCVILDYVLPDMNGLDFLSAAAELSNHKCGFVMITGQGDEEVAVQAMKAGAHDYLVKGNISQQSLYRAIKNAVENVRLRKDLAEKNRELLERNQELADKNEELEKFAYVASHDLKQPLRTLKGHLNLFGKKYEELFDEEGRKFLGIMSESIERMSNLIDDLLKYATLGSEVKEFSCIDSSLALGIAKMNLDAVIRETAAEITNAPLPMVMGDLTLLSQVFQNLIHNAINYRSEAPPRVHVSAEKRGQMVVFSVRDNGIGIAKAHCERIFQAFRRLHSYSEYAGNGLGLATCKKVVQLHGGRIWVASAPGKGSTFYFSLPMGSVQQKSLPEEVAEPVV